VSAALNLVLDFTLIPKYGAIGAAFANGGTQTFFSLVLWLAAVRLLKIRFPILPIAKTAMVAVAMAVAVRLVVSRLPALLGLTLAVILGAAIYLVLVRATRVLYPADHERLLHLRNSVPANTRRLFEASLNWLIANPASGG
jgi:O-antigen/teichoic acid export membrane protein